MINRTPKQIIHNILDELFELLKLVNGETLVRELAHINIVYLLHLDPNIRKRMKYYMEVFFEDAGDVIFEDGKDMLSFMEELLNEQRKHFFDI